MGSGGFVSGSLIKAWQMFLFITNVGVNKNGLPTMSAVERFSIECHKTETKVITTANQMKSKYHKEPIRTQSKYM